MRKIMGIILAFLAFPATCIASGPMKGKVVSVSSGDLISFQDQYGEIRQLSLYGIDAPDNEQKMGQHAKKMLFAMIGEKDVIVKLIENESKGIPSAYVALNGLSINAALVKAGCAWVNQETCKSSKCSNWTGYQHYAKKNKKGLWIDPEAKPPWEWRQRRMKAEEIVKKLNTESEFTTYYGSLAESGRRSLWAQKSLPRSISSTGISSGIRGGPSSSGTALRSNSGAKPSKASSGSSGGSPRPRRG